MSLEHLGSGVFVFTSEVHKFSTDTVLLSDFCKPVSGLKVAELGAGCGALSLLWFRDETPGFVTAIEIQDDACSLLRRSIIRNNLGDKFKVVGYDLKNFRDTELNNYFDLVVCNPPYNPVGAGILSSSAQKQIADNELSCSLTDIARFANRHLKHLGRLCICLRAGRLCDAISSMRENNIEPKKLRFVHYKGDRPSKLFLLEGRKGAKPFLEVLPPLVMKGENLESTPEFKKIYSFWESGESSER